MPEDDPVRDAHAVLAKHYGEPVLPIGQVCERLAIYVQALKDNDSDGPFGSEAAEAIRLHGSAIIMYARKSNLLYRLLYLDQRLRTERCPTHKGEWSGYGFAGDHCECQVGPDLTGWLPRKDGHA